MRDEAIYDAIIVGLGAAGSVFAAELTRAGLRVLALEYGPHYTEHREDFEENELASWPLIWDSNRYRVTGDFQGVPNLGCGVGGGTLAWTAVSLRMFEHDFAFRSRFGAPAGTSVRDWPFGVDTLRTYYAQAERQMGVAGSNTPWSCGDTDSLHAPLPLYETSKRIAAAMSQLGIRAAPGRIATNADAYDGRPGCIHCGFCRSGCRTDAKYQADRVLVAPALRGGRLTLRTGVAVSRIVVGADGRRVEGVEFIDRASGQSHSARARVVVACNNPFELPRLFLNSAAPTCSSGLGNQHDQVGRHLFFHLGTIGVGITSSMLRSYTGHNMGNVMSLDFAVPRPGVPFQGGFSLLSVQGAGAGVMAVDPLRNLYGAELKRVMRRYGQSLSLISFVEGFPSSDNRVTVLEAERDELGLARAAITYRFKPRELELVALANDTIRRVFAAADCEEVHITPAPFEAHPMGTMRMGDDPRCSVTDPYGRVHGIDNLYVGGAALFVTGSAVNPTLTIHALALHTSEQILVRDKEGAHGRGAC